MIRVLICDDHQIVRQGIKQMLADVQDIAVAGEAENGPDAIGLVREAAVGGQGTGCGIDVVLMDIAMPHRDGLDVLRQLRTEFPKLPVLMLSTYPDKQYAVRSLKLGAAGYLNKSADSQVLCAAIRKVAEGGLFITPAVAEHVAMALGAGQDLLTVLAPRDAVKRCWQAGQRSAPAAVPPRALVPAHRLAPPPCAAPSSAPAASSRAMGRSASRGGAGP